MDKDCEDVGNHGHDDPFPVTRYVEPALNAALEQRGCLTNEPGIITIEHYCREQPQLLTQFLFRGRVLRMARPSGASLDQ